MHARQERMLCHYALNYLRKEVPELKAEIEQLPHDEYRDHVILTLKLMERDLAEIEKLNDRYA